MLHDWEILFADIEKGQVKVALSQELDRIFILIVSDGRNFRESFLSLKSIEKAIYVYVHFYWLMRTNLNSNTEHRKLAWNPIRTFFYIYIKNMKDLG